jgi:hypothetical protein
VTVLKLVEIVIGMALMYFGIEKLCNSDQASSVIYGVIAIAGLIVTVHGLLVYLVPDFFSPV